MSKPRKNAEIINNYNCCLITLKHFLINFTRKLRDFLKKTELLKFKKYQEMDPSHHHPNISLKTSLPPNLFLIKSRLPTAIHLACQKNSKLLHHNSKWKSGLKINIDSFLHYEIRRKIERIEKSILSWIILPFYSFVMKLDIDYFLLFEKERKKFYRGGLSRAFNLNSNREIDVDFDLFRLIYSQILFFICFQ